MPGYNHFAEFLDILTPGESSMHVPVIRGAIQIHNHAAPEEKARLDVQSGHGFLRITRHDEQPIQIFSPEYKIITQHGSCYTPREIFNPPVASLSLFHLGHLGVWDVAEVKIDDNNREAFTGFLKIIVPNHNVKIAA